MTRRDRIPLLLLLAVIPGPNAWGADAAEDAAIADILRLGGSVTRIAANSEDREIQFYLSDQEITDDALKSVPHVKNLVWLNLRGTAITDAGLAHLSKIKTLTRLHLEKTALGDAGLKHLSGLKRLEYLNLYGTKVTDSGLDALQDLKQLKKLYVWQTAVTQAGADRLQAALPDLEIVLGDEPQPPAAEPQTKDEAEKPQ